MSEITCEYISTFHQELENHVSNTAHAMNHIFDTMNMSLLAYDF